MSRKKAKKRKLDIQRKGKQEPQHTTPSAASSDSVSFTFNQQNFSLHTEGLSELQVVAILPQTLQQEALSMARNEQAYRHEVTNQLLSIEHKERMDALHKDFMLKRHREISRTISEIIGKIFALVIVSLLVAALYYYLQTEKELSSAVWKYLFGAAVVICGYLIFRKKSAQ